MDLGKVRFVGIEEGLRRRRFRFGEPSDISVKVRVISDEQQKYIVQETIEVGRLITALIRRINSNDNDSPKPDSDI